MQNDSSKFKDEFYKRLIRFSLEIIKFCNELRKDRNLSPVADQLIRSGISVGANITEAKSCGSKKTILDFLKLP